MNKNRFHNPAYRMLVALLSVSLLIGPGAGPAYAAQTALADIPIASKVTAKPNIVYTLDDSGSMQFNYLPDWVIAAQGAAVEHHQDPRVGTTATATVASTAALTHGPVRHDLRSRPARIRRQLPDHGYKRPRPSRIRSRARRSPRRPWRRSPTRSAPGIAAAATMPRPARRTTRTTAPRSSRRRSTRRTSIASPITPTSTTRLRSRPTALR